MEAAKPDPDHEALAGLVERVTFHNPESGFCVLRVKGESVSDVIEQAPERLREVTGIGPKRAERIVAGWADQR